MAWREFCRASKASPTFFLGIWGQAVVKGMLYLGTVPLDGVLCTYPSCTAPEALAGKIDIGSNHCALSDYGLCVR